MRFPFFSRPDPLAGLRAVLPELQHIDYASLPARLDAELKPSLTLMLSRFDQKFLFRARLSPRDRPFPKVGDLGSMPPHLLHLLTTFGRVNKPGEAMFYASTQPYVACVETARHIFSREDPGGLDLTVGTWRVVEPLIVASLLRSPAALDGMREFQDFEGQPHDRRDVRQRIRDAEKENARLETAFKTQVPWKKRRAAVELLRFFSDEFARLDAEPWHFKLTNYYKDAAFRLHDEIDGFWYESVGYGFQYSNVAITPQAVEKKLRFECASAARMTYIPEEGSANFHVMQEDVPADAEGTIAWRQGSREEMDGASRIASIRSIADLAEAKLAPDRGTRSAVTCTGILVFGKPEAMDARRLQANLDELHGKCGRRALILFVGYGKAVPFTGMREVGGGWLFSEGMWRELSEYVANRSGWMPSGELQILAFPIFLMRGPKWWKVEFPFQLGYVVDWKRARSHLLVPVLGDFLSRLYRAAEEESDDLTAILDVVGSTLRDPGTPLRVMSVPVRWKHEGQR